MSAVISVDNIGKAYKISHAGGGGGSAQYRTLRDDVGRLVTSPFRRLSGSTPKDTVEEYWALKDVAFDVQPGEVVGIVGKNGAGKSTLLKVLSRITKPTVGKITLRGRVGSLLEVGTGFHPELTGRENIFLNGSILGMSRREIAAKFDEIVAFSEVERFLDTPVKRYSSGMYVRLAFAVAAHLEPEILIIDEVLAVGDQSFQKKSLGKMGEVSRSGRTVLFVSHNMAAVESLCKRCVLLDAGRLVTEGDTASVLTRYLRIAAADGGGRVDLTNHQGRAAKSKALMTAATLSDGVEPWTTSLKMGSDLVIKVDYDPAGKTFPPVLGVLLKTGVGTTLFGINNRFVPNFEFEPTSSPGTITCRIPKPPLMPGNYVVDLFLGDAATDLDVVQDALSFDMVESDVFGSGKLPPRMAGSFYWPASWELENEQGR